MRTSCPDKCPVCGKSVIAIFRTWFAKKNVVEVEFCHEKGNKDCKKKYID